MTSLHDLQQAFVSAVRFGDAAAVARLVDANGIEPERRVRIYANNVRENFLATLEATYPVLLRLAGHDWFRQTGASYLHTHPSRSGNLHYVGERFAAFLEAYLGDSAYAYFVDVEDLNGRHPPLPAPSLQGRLGRTFVAVGKGLPYMVGLRSYRREASVH